MARLTILATCLGALAASASANANRIEFYFSTSGSLDAIPSEYTAETVPTINIGDTGYLWAYVQGSTVRWMNVAIEFDGPTITGGQAYDPVTYWQGEPVWRRWNQAGDKDPADDNYINCPGVPEVPVSGLGKDYHPSDPPEGDYLTVGAPDNPGTTRHFLIAEMQFGATGSVFLKVGAGFILKDSTSNPPTDDIYFGFGDGVKEHIVKGDPPVLAYGSDVGASTPTPDLYVVPEPANVLLIGLAALALRRR